jgi:transposase
MNNCTPRLTSASFDNGLVELCRSDATGSSFHPIWLRDNCRCASCGDPATGYRNLRLTTLDLEDRPVTLAAAATQLRITWQDQHETVFSSAWLREHANPLLTGAYGGTLPRR